MPDWITHLGTTYIATQTVSRLKPGWQFDIQPLLIGAVLPDATRFVVILVDMLDWPAIPTFTYFIPFHSLLIVAFLAGAVALLLPGRAFGLLMLGASGHFLLDELEGRIGCGSTTFYPFYFGRPISGWPEAGAINTGLLIVSLIGLGVALSRPWPGLRLRLTAPRLVGAGGLLLIASIIPLFFGQWMIERNAYYLGFVTNPTEGQPVAFCFSEVVETAPLTIEEFDRSFALDASADLSEGDWVSLRGVYQGGRIEPNILIQHAGFSDIPLSLVAGLVIGLLFFGDRLPF